MGVSKDEVVGMARLARVPLTPEEVERLVLELSRVLQHVEALTGVDVTGLAGVGDMTEWSIPLEPRSEPDTLVRPPEASAPEWTEGFFVVPRLPALDVDANDAERSDPAP